MSAMPINKISKKRKTSIIPWRKDVDKYRRCQPKGPPLPPSCNHSYSKFECSLLGQKEMESFHRKFYYTRNKAQQDAFILRHCQGMSPKRKSSVAQKERKLTVEYYVPAREHNAQVCKEAFIGILRVNKSRINALLKSFYKVGISKDNTQEQSSSMMKRISRDRRKKGEARKEHATNSKSLTNIEDSAQRDFSFIYRCQSECEAHDKISGYSISLMENKVQEEKFINHGSETNSVNEDNLCDWLKLDSKARRHRTFNWSPLRRTPCLASSIAVDGKRFDSSQKKNVSELPYSILYHSSSNIINPKQIAGESSQQTIANQILDSSQMKNVATLSHTILCYSSNNDINRNNICKEAASESFQQTIPNQRVSLHDHVYESKKRRLRKLEIIDGKENIHQNSIKKKNNIHNSKHERKTKSIVTIKTIEKKSFQESKANKFAPKARFPLRTLC